MDAGPGTGKTAVACARVARLVMEHELQPTRIWLVSFTRTAVREIRQRLTVTLGNQEAAHAVRIATLDSHAWALHSGFDETARLTGSHDRNIEEVLRLVREDEQVADYLASVEHLIVDEAQDVVGIRADLVHAIISRLSDGCGVTVFADEAQAIYGFADDSEVDDTRAGPPVAGAARLPPLTGRLRDGQLGFERRALEKVFRTDSPTLRSLFVETRAKVLQPSGNPAQKLAELKQEIKALAGGTVHGIDQQELEGAEDLFVLFRRRAEVLLASSLLRSKGVRHRIRMSGMPVCILPWVGACLGEHGSPMLTRRDFLDLWQNRVTGTACELPAADEAWELLVRYAGRTETLIEMRRLRAVLGRSQPPADFCAPELGTEGPILGTIHASKGREAASVHLMMPGMPGENLDLEEEARVVFVGATRARSSLMVGQGFTSRATRLESGRVYARRTSASKNAAQVEIGMDGDVSIEGAAGKAIHGSAATVREIQARLLRLAGSSCAARARCDRDAGFTYRILAEDGDAPLGALTSRVNQDLFEIARVVQERSRGGRRRPPDEIWHLHVAGVRTAVLPPDSPEAQRLHAPWAASGVALVPVVLGYTKVYFPTLRRKS
ncbi:UvrD-helicase domain-containing protein [Sorangium sp. So ce128]|uniref:UvrD-helicase domain-containing protein n=1 Tax=Sorangium sp. So ce128 TaxID=3133281 RepID=UPI003F5F65B1